MSPVNQHVLPIEALIGSRLEELGLRPVDVVRACGYKNVSKGLRRLEALRAGYFSSSSFLVSALPAILDVDPKEIERAISDTEQHFEKAAEEAYRASFVPHAIIKTDRERPEPLFVAFAIGVNRLIRVDFDLDAGSITFPKQAIDGIAEKLASWKMNSLPAFGQPIGFFVNYSPTNAVEFDLKGNPLKKFNQSIRPGKVQFSLCGRVITEDEKRVLFGLAS